MKTLEVEPLRDKKLSVAIIEKEYDEPWWCVEPKLGKKRFIEKVLNIPSLPFCDFLEQIIHRKRPDFVTDELGMRTNKEFYDNKVSRLLKESYIPFFPVEIDENARIYLSSSLEEIREERDEVVNIISQLPKDYENKRDREYLIAYAQYLDNEFEKGCENIKCSTRLDWITMGILEHTKKVGKKRINSIHICSPKSIQKLTTLLESLEVEVTSVSIEKKINDEVKILKKN